jgi:hypothetical protein
MQPPKVIVPLPNEKVKIGSPVLLRATIIGKPTPSVRFYVQQKSLSLVSCLVCLVQRWCTINCVEPSSYSLRG